MHADKCCCCCCQTKLILYQYCYDRVYFFLSLYTKKKPQDGLYICIHVYTYTRVCTKHTWYMMATAMERHVTALVRVIRHRRVKFNSPRPHDYIISFFIPSTYTGAPRCCDSFRNILHIRISNVPANTCTSHTIVVVTAVPTPYDNIYVPFSSSRHTHRPPIPFVPSRRSRLV